MHNHLRGLEEKAKTFIKLVNRSNNSVETISLTEMIVLNYSTYKKSFLNKVGKFILKPLNSFTGKTIIMMGHATHEGD